MEGLSRTQLLQLLHDPQASSPGVRPGLAGAPGNLLAGIQAFAAGAILTMLASTMMPEAFEEGGATVGVVTTFGFLAAFVLSKLEG